jgi:hypothetical protein
MCQAGPSYVPVGPQLNVPLATVTNGGWTQCYLDDFNQMPSIASVQMACNRNRVMLGCRLTGSNTIQLLAWAPRADVFFDTGNGNVLHNANNTGWYFSTGWSMGFAAQGEAVSRNSCDTAAGATHLCYHTGGGNLNQGYRCGNNTGLQGGVRSHERIIFHAN